jgi:hypothetical protein
MMAIGRERGMEVGEGRTIAVLVLWVGVVSVVSARFKAEAGLTKREKASLNSDTCSSVNESA